jgi:hypothetical protein
VAARCARVPAGNSETKISTRSRYARPRLKVTQGHERSNPRSTILRRSGDSRRAPNGTRTAARYPKYAN